MRSDPEVPTQLAPSELLLEIAAILAAGLHRLRQQVDPNATVGPQSPVTAHGSPQITPESSLSGLEDCAPTRPDGSWRQPVMTQEESRCRSTSMPR